MSELDRIMQQSLEAGGVPRVTRDTKQNPRDTKQILEVGGVNCQSCSGATLLTDEDKRRVAAAYAAKHGVDSLTSKPGVRNRPAPPTMSWDDVHRLDQLLGPRRLRGIEGAAHWLLADTHEGHPLHGPRFDLRGATSQLRQRNSLALVPSEHNLAFLVVTGLEGGTESRDAQDRAWAQARELAKGYGGILAHPYIPDTNTKRKWPLLVFACSNAGRGLSEVVVHGLRGWLIERYPLEVIDVLTWRLALERKNRVPLPPQVITQEVPNPYPAPSTDNAALAEFRSWFLTLPPNWQSKAGVDAKSRDGWLSNAKIRKTFDAACFEWNCDQGPMRKNGTRHEPLALWLSRYELGDRKKAGPGNNKQRGRTRLAWRVGGGRHLDSLLIRG